MDDDDPTTTELRLDQLRKEKVERDRAEEAPTPDAEDQHGRRAERAAYLRERLEQRERAEGEAAAEDAAKDPDAG